MNAETIKKSKTIKSFLKNGIKEMSKKSDFFGHCKKHLLTDEKNLVRQALNPINKFGVGSCFNFSEMKELKIFLISNMLQDPVYSEIALWLAEGSESCVFYIEAPECGIAFSKKHHDWSQGPLVCNQAIILLERDADYRFKIKTAYPLPDLY